MDIITNFYKTLKITFNLDSNIYINNPIGKVIILHLDNNNINEMFILFENDCVFITTLTKQNNNSTKYLSINSNDILEYLKEEIKKNYI